MHLRLIDRWGSQVEAGFMSVSLNQLLDILQAIYDMIGGDREDMVSNMLAYKCIHI